MKRFYKAASSQEIDGGYAIFLDSRPVKTPGRVPLVAPTAALAQEILAEWDAQGDEIDPAAMPMTGLTNAAIDRVGSDRLLFVDDISGYAETDLICYRADGPQELVDRQAAVWDPLIEWAAHALDAPLITVTGILAKDQPEQSLSAIRAHVDKRSHFELVALSKLTSLSGSVVIALAAAERALPLDELWQASLLDELWQEERWGDDDFALKHRADRARDFMAAARFLAAVQTS